MPTRFIDRQGKEVPNGTKCLAVHKNKNSSMTVYHKSEVNELINDIKAAGRTGPMTTMEYWQPIVPLYACAYEVPDGCDAGQCSIGSCSFVDDPDWPHCMCL
jgi:hypothetical protein